MVDPSPNIRKWHNLINAECTQY